MHGGQHGDYRGGVNRASPSSTGAPLDDHERRLLDAPERYRGWCRSMASLTGTASAAIAAGVVFSPRTVLALPAQYAGAAAFLLLLLATGLFGRASIMRMADSGSTSDAHYARTLADKLSEQLRLGSIAAACALVALAAMLAISLFVSESRIDVVVLWPEGRTQIGEACPRVVDRIGATVLASDLMGSDQLVPARVDGEECGLDEDSAWILIDRLSAVIVPKGG